MTRLQTLSLISMMIHSLLGFVLIPDGYHWRPTTRKFWRVALTLRSLASSRVPRSRFADQPGFAVNSWRLLHTAISLLPGVSTMPLVWGPVCDANLSAPELCFRIVWPSWTGLGAMLFMPVTLHLLILERFSAFFLLDGVGLLVVCPNVVALEVHSKLLADRVSRLSLLLDLQILISSLSAGLCGTALWVSS